jgi:hypothetical protein
MASVEFIQQRIEGARKRLESLTKKYNRILKAEASNYEKDNPYYYDASDKRSTEREMRETIASIDKYAQQLATEMEKNNSRNVQVIIDFLNEWKTQVYTKSEKDIRDAYQLFLEMREELQKCNFGKYTEEYLELRSKWNNYTKGVFEDQEYTCPATKKVRKTRVKVLDGKWEYIMPYFTSNNVEEGLKKLDKDLQQEANRKYDFIIERVNKIAGEIVDASDLHIRAGELNGIIVGTKGSAKVTTIGAGGYNIQQFHFRTLIHEVK